MGVDVVEIGVRHRLPVHDQKKLAREFATIFNTNVKVVAHNEFEYDEAANKVVESTTGEHFIPLYEVKLDDTSQYIRLNVVDYQKKQIRNRLTATQLKTLSFASPEVKELFEESWDEIYEANFIKRNNRDDDWDYSWFYIYREHIEIPCYIPGRWHLFIDYFKEPNLLYLIKIHREKINHLAKRFGCSHVIYCSSQTVSSRILDNMSMSPASLLTYTKTSSFIEAGEQKEYEKSRVISLNAFLKGDEHLADDEYIEAIIDDLEEVE